MDYRGVLLIGLVGAAALVGATTSCTAADPGQITFSERPKGQTGDLTGGGSPVNPEGGTTADGGAEGGASGGLVTAFAGAPPYNAAGQANGASTNAQHNFPGNTPITNPAGQSCVDCHKAGGTAANAIFGVAGTVYNAAAGTTAVAKAEVRVVDANGKELSKVYSDALGNFWSDAIVGGLPGGAKVGVRNATVTKLMTTALTTQDASCQKAGCHVVGGAGATGRVFLQ